MLAGKVNLLQTVPYRVRIIYMDSGNHGHTDNGIHGCAHIMAHIGKKRRLGLILLLPALHF